MAARSARVASSSSRHSTASAPCATCGTNTDGSRTPRRCWSASSKPLQRRDRHDDRASGRHLRQPRLDVAAQLDELEIGADVGELRAPAHRTGGDRRAGCEVGESESDEAVARVTALGHGGDRETRRRRSTGDPSRSGRRSRHRPRAPRPAPPSRTRPGRRARGSGGRALGRRASRRARARRRCRRPRAAADAATCSACHRARGLPRVAARSFTGSPAPRARTGRAGPRRAAHPERCPRPP